MVVQIDGAHHLVVRSRLVPASGIAVALMAAGCGSSPASPARLDVAVGHCFVMQVSFDGDEWNVPFADQFGEGGEMPSGWVGSGVMRRVDERTALFEDDGGTTIEFLPADDPAVSPVDDAGCD